MKILVACEYSGAVRDAFRALGHDAISCDLLASEKPGPHYQGDVTDLLAQQWDMIIAFPPCTFLTISQNRWLKDQPPRKSGALVGAARRAARVEAVRFFKLLAEANCPRICVENPVGCMSTEYRKPDQVIQPWQFGHGEIKKTCFWLKGLPLLKPTDIVSGREARVHRAAPGPDRWKERSTTYAGVAAAMAAQWGQSI